ncbi:dephospho-CoA kinase [Alkalibacterium iburiense]|uniref:Dephospho-CoA kinase n=1 Tax=Alkalibacterium iburiense TaxID=290589 RepID=A0ABN0XLR4_9LACT
MTFVLGLTGGIASGKTTVSNHFKTLQIPVIDADIIARKVMEPGQAALQKVVAAFGQDILLADGTLNRKKLGEIVFTHPEKLEQLNKIVQKEIYTHILSEKEKFIMKGVPLLVLDIPLLFEAGYEDEVDEIMVVYTTHENQLKRLMKRNQLSEAEAQARIQSQLSLNVKKEKADSVIDNNGSVEKTLEQVDAWLSEQKGISPNI